MRISTVIAPLIPLAFLLWELWKKKGRASSKITEQAGKVPSTGVIFFWLVPVGTPIFGYTLLLLCGTGGVDMAPFPFLSPFRWLSIILYLFFSGLALYFHHRKERTRALHCIIAIVIFFSGNLIYEGVRAIVQENLKTILEHYQGNDAVTQGILLVVIGALAVVFWVVASALGKKFMKLNTSGQQQAPLDRE
jgi:hypothetical protein